MAKIPEYVAPKASLQEAYSAFETAGRRLGGMYRTAADSEITASKVAGETAAQGIEWPYVLQSLTPGSGVSVKTVGGGSSSGSGFGATYSPNLAAEDAAAYRDLYGTGGSTLPQAAKARSQLNALDNFTKAMGQVLASAPLPSKVGLGPNAAAEKDAQQVYDAGGFATSTSTTGNQSDSYGDFGGGGTPQDTNTAIEDAYSSSDKTGTNFYSSDYMGPSM